MCASRFLSACIFIAKLLLDTCFIPLHMNNLYIYQIYILILSEPSDSHKTVQRCIYILEMPDFNIRMCYKLIFRTGISLLPFSNVAGVHGKEDSNAVHFRCASKTISTPTARPDSLTVVTLGSMGNFLGLP